MPLAKAQAIRVTCVRGDSPLLSPNPVQPRRGQAATEFMMTYGWAIMTVIIVFGVIYYYVDFSGSNTCKIDSPFVCGDVKASSSGNEVRVQLSVEANDVQRVSSLSVVSEKGTCYGGQSSGDAPFNGAQLNLNNPTFGLSSQKVTINAYCPGFSFKKGDTLKGDIQIGYDRRGKLSHIAYGTYYAKVE